MATKETDLKNQCKDFLKAKGIFNVPLLAGLAAYKGLPDRFAFHKDKTYALEFKAPKGKMSDHQIQFREDFEATGRNHIYLEVRAVEDLMTYF